MTTAPAFKTTMDFTYGQPSVMAAGVQRLVAPNPGPFTFKGTNTYIVGERTLAVIDPGPDDPDHLAALLAVIGDRPVSHIVVTHTHRDHIDLLAKLQAATGARTAGYGRAQLETPGLLRSPTGTEFVDVSFAPDIRLGDGDVIEGPGWALKAVHTPGHAPDHHCFELLGTRLLFSGDHVMSWNTSVVAPPEGNMGHYYASLERLIGADHEVYLPGHGGRLHDPVRMTKAFLVHRRWREEAILAAIRDGSASVAAVADLVYKGLDPKLSRAAQLSVMAHVEHLVARGLVAAEGPLHFEQRLRPL